MFAVWKLITTFLTWMLGLMALLPGLEASGFAAGKRGHLLAAVILATFTGVYVFSLTEAYLSDEGPAWRLVRLEDGQARTLRPFGLLGALVVIVATSFSVLILIVKPPAAMATALQALVALGCTLFIIGFLIVVGRIRANDERAGAGGVLDGRLAALALLALWPASIVILLRGAFGYVTWSIETSLWLIWASIVLLTWHLASRMIDDGCRAVFSDQNRLGRSARARFGVRDRALVQFGVVVSALLRLALLLVAGLIVLAPFGSGLASVFDTGAGLGEGLRIGEVTISPTALGRALVVLVAALAVFKTARRWLVDRYLPTTSLDAGAANSIGVVTGYLGTAAAVLWSLAALGVQVQQLAFLVSALSVGIGFGLQAIAQNFVSGLILLAERPIRIGDRVRVGGLSGRVGRISVRATQILADDGSRLIVPNSELVTKTVETIVTSEIDAPTIIRGEIVVDLDSDLDAVRHILIAAAQRHPRVQAAPEPTAYILAIARSVVTLRWSAAIGADQDADRVRGEVWLAIIGDLRANRIALRSEPGSGSDA